MPPAEMEPQDGEQVMEAAGLALSLKDRLLTAELTNADGSVETLRLSLRSGEETLSPGEAVPDSGEGAAS